MTTVYVRVCYNCTRITLIFAGPCFLIVLLLLPIWRNKIKYKHLPAYAEHSFCSTLRSATLTTISPTADADLT